jgi:hypothetical protein
MYVKFRIEGGTGSRHPVKTVGDVDYHLPILKANNIWCICEAMHSDFADNKIKDHTCI